MGITQNILNLDAYYRRTSGDKIIVNDLNYFSITDIEKLNSSLMTIYNNSDTLSTIPSCDCGNFNGRYLVDKYCPDCGTKCKEVHDKVEPLLWLKSMTPDLKFMNPDFWLILAKTMDKKIDYIRWLCDVKYNPPVEIPNFVHGVKELLGGIRTYENTMKNIPAILKYLMNHSRFKEIDKQEHLQLLLDMYNKYKHDLFTEHLPIINKKLFVMENTTKGRFVNLAVSDVIDVVMMWIKAVNDDSKNEKKMSSATATAVSKLAGLYHTYFENYVVQKIGIFRKHVYGARSHFTFRSVIASVPGKHMHDELHVPWAIGLTVMRPHLLNKLVKRGYTYKTANYMLFKGIKRYDPVLDELLNELIAESPYKGIPVIGQRNPSLKQGSAQRLFITKFKSNDIFDFTINISQLIIKTPNGDYDGDSRI